MDVKHGGLRNTATFKAIYWGSERCFSQTFTYISKMTYQFISKEQGQTSLPLIMICQEILLYLWL